MSLAAMRAGEGLPRAPNFPPARGFCPPRQLALAAIAVVLIAFGSRCWTIAAFGSDLPFWDQWDGEGRDVFLPWFTHQLSWYDLSHPHNEHRILLTRLADLGLLLLNGQWDARLEAVVGSLIQSGLGGLIVYWTARDFSTRAALGFAAAVAAAFALPFAYENILGGFQLQMFLLLFLSIAGLRLLVVSRPLTLRSWAGVLVAILCLGTMASGFFAAAAAIPILAWTAWRSPESRPQFAILGGVLAAIMVFGLATRVAVPDTAALAAHSAHDFFWSLGRIAAWPRWRATWTAFVYALPWAIFMIVELKKKAAPQAPARWLAGIGLWALAQIAAIAYGRRPDPFPAPRYLDLLLFWQLVNVAAAFALCAIPRRPQMRGWTIAALSLWGAFLAIAFVPLIHKDLRPELTRWRDDSRSYEQSVRGYVNTGDPVYLEGKIPYPLPRANTLRELLDQKAIQEILPSSVARPSARMGWLSGMAIGIVNAGPWILGLGILAFGLAAKSNGSSLRKRL